ncbi:MAG: hypothetical protein D3903_05370 [Candidatus Electrothrix sp. GM3_4]|nr:hypothetical protein [Candidatus Electrothrix sp. GM3_4]
MIIKSMSRKKPSFAQLLKYMSKGADEDYIYTRNLYSLNAEGIIQEFRENYSFLRRQKNSNALYHEVIAFTKAKGISIKEQKEKIIEAVEEYMKIRAKDCLVYGRIHEAENNLHIHLMFSSNAIEQSKNHYLSQKQFDKVKVDFEKYVLKKYPELEQKPILTKNREKKKEGVMSQKEFEVKKRTGKITNKESIQYRLTQIFNSSPTKEIFFDNLRSNNIEIYVRGKKTIGFKDLGDNERAYRLNTLGLSAEFNKMSSVLAEELKAKKEDFKKPSSSKRREAPKQGEEEPKAKGKEQEALDEIREYRKNMTGGKTKKK